MNLTALGIDLRVRWQDNDFMEVYAWMLSQRVREHASMATATTTAAATTEHLAL